jgi:thiosulfate/3-mercaptopyruvate sulfurtransferase
MRQSLKSLDSSCPVPDGFRADLVRWRQLVSVEWLAAWLAQAPVAAVPAADWHLLEVACDGFDAYRASHIPGAAYLDTRQFEQLPFWNTVPDAELRRVLQLAGVGADSTVVLYGRNMLAAARVAQLMLVAGVPDVRLLDGGMRAWCAAGQALRSGMEAEGVSPDANAGVRVGADGDDRTDGDAGDTQPARFAARPDYLLNTAQAKALRLQPGSALVSIRTRAEYLGETSGYGYIAARGEIAGALWGHAGTDGDVHSMGNFQDALGRMKPAAEIAALWREAGVRPEMQIAFYCGTGWRASLAFFYAWLMGWERISVYDGGWFEWSSDPTHPVICRTKAVSGLA